MEICIYVQGSITSANSAHTARVIGEFRLNENRALNWSHPGSAEHSCGRQRRTLDGLHIAFSCLPSGGIHSNHLDEVFGCSTSMFGCGGVHTANHTYMNRVETAVESAAWVRHAKTTPPAEELASVINAGGTVRSDGSCCVSSTDICSILA